MFLQPPEELAGPQWSSQIAPTFRPEHDSGSDTNRETECLPGFLVQARAAAARQPESPLAMARLAQASQCVGDWNGAVTAARRALELGLEASDAGAVHAASAILASYGHGRDAVSLIDDTRADDLPVAVRVRAAIAANELHAAQHLPGIETSPDALIVVAWLRTEQGDFQGAVVAARQAERSGATGVGLYANLGYAHAALGNLTKAIKFTRVALALSPADRRIAFNLAHYLRLAGHDKRAVAVLDAIKQSQATDIELALARARLLRDMGRLADAHRELQRARASQAWAHAGDIQRAELTANLAMLRWITNRDKADWTLQEIVRALKTCDYRSVSVANLLMNLMLRPSHAEQLRQILGRLENRHRDSELLGLRTLLAILERDPDAAIEHSVAWAKHDVFNPFGAAAATILVGELGADFEAASEIGLATLRRVPRDLMLLNNTAFVLAMAGHLHRAKKLLDQAQRIDSASVHVIATRGLVNMLIGDIDRGRAGYRDAQRLALAEGDDGLAARVVVYAAMAERAAGAGLELPDPEQFIADQVPPELRELPGFWIASERLKQARIS